MDKSYFRQSNRKSMRTKARQIQSNAIQNHNRTKFSPSTQNQSTYPHYKPIFRWGIEARCVCVCAYSALFSIDDVFVSAFRICSIHLNILLSCSANKKFVRPLSDDLHSSHYSVSLLHANDQNTNLRITNNYCTRFKSEIHKVFVFCSTISLLTCVKTSMWWDMDL